MRQLLHGINIDALDTQTITQMSEHTKPITDSILPPPVTCLSDNPPLTDIFSYRFWGVEEAMDHLIGIFRLSKVEGTEFLELTTLDGKVYCDPNDSEVISSFINLHDRLMKIWDHDDKDDEYTPGYFIRWGLRHKHIFEIPWLEDAFQKNLISREVLTPKVKRGAAPGDELRENERKKMLAIIGGMAIKKYSYPAHTSIKRIKNDIEGTGLSISDNTLSKYLSLALEEVPPEERKKIIEKY